MGKLIEVKHEEEAVKVPVQRLSGGPLTDRFTITVPKELHKSINKIMVKTGKSKSAVISELIEKGLK